MIKSVITWLRSAVCAAVQLLRRYLPWLKREELVQEQGAISKETAEDFIRASTWWLTHYRRPVRAPGHARRLYNMPDHGWAIDFGANTFLVGKAIERCKEILNQARDDAAKGSNLVRTDIVQKLKLAISGAVAKYDGEEYSGYYPIRNDDLVFGAQSIDVDDASEFMIEETDSEELFLNK